MTQTVFPVVSYNEMTLDEGWGRGLTNTGVFFFDYEGEADETESGYCWATGNQKWQGFVNGACHGPDY